MAGRIAALLLLVFSLSSCGKRELPPSPDRWAPKLSGAKALDRNHVDLFFSEKMDETTAGRRESYSIADTGGGSLSIYSASLLPDKQIVRLTTQEQAPVEYSVAVSGITDLGANEVRRGSVSRFKGSTLRDTTSPHVGSVYPQDGSVGVPGDTAIQIVFSETMDTSSASLRRGSIVLLPPPFDSSFSWNEGMNIFYFSVASLSSGKSSLYVTRGCMDHSGNGLARQAKSIFTTADSMSGGFIEGKVSVPVGTTPFGSSVGLFDSLWTPLLLILTDSSGSFTFTHLEDGLYSVAAGQDEDGDDRFDIRGRSGELAIEGSLPVEGVAVELTREEVLPDPVERYLGNFRLMNSGAKEGD
jgi:hypothetical protein